WDMTTVVSLDGSITYGIGPNPGGLGGQTSIAVDTSGGPYDGNVYLLCTVDRNSNSDPADVMFARSTNGGASFSSPVRVNDDAGTSAWQWFGTMSVAPTGRIDVIWLDTRDNLGTYMSALYYSF
ncbi:MAG: glycoside hydrolase, partial [Ignavibacteriaceae bacterium]|nr:glycoside hydrolase [Ignavibacteriaceae bacterium]